MFISLEGLCSVALTPFCLTWIKSKNKGQVCSCHFLTDFMSLVSFYNLLKTSEKPDIFWCFQGVLKQTSGMKWLNGSKNVVKGYKRLSKHFLKYCEVTWNEKEFKGFNLVNQFYATVLFLYPMKTSKNLWFSDVIREHTGCAKSVRVRSYSGPYFPAFGLSVFRSNAGKYGP